MKPKSILSSLRRATLAWALAVGAIVTLAPPVVHSAVAARKKKKDKKRAGAKRQSAQAAAAKREGKRGAKREIKHEGELAPKKEYDFSDAMGVSKEIIPVPEQAARPTLSLVDREKGGPEAMLDEKLEEEIDLTLQLLQFQTDCDNGATPRFRLADLYWEKSKRAFFKANDDKISAKDKAAYSQLMLQLQHQTIQNYQKIVDDCPAYPDYPKTLYYLGKALTEIEKPKDGATFFQRVIKEYADSEWVANSWFMVGEYFFNYGNDAYKALKAYKKAAEHPENPTYGYAVYKQGWCYVNTGDWDLALERFRQVITISEDRAQKLDQSGRTGLRKEGLKDFVRAYSHVGDANKAWADFVKLGGPKDAPWMIEQLGTWYIHQGDHKETITVYHALIENQPRSTRLPVYQGRIVDAASRLGDRGRTVTFAKQLTKYFDDVRERAKKGDLNEEEKATIKKDLKEADEIAENTLRRLAMEYHKEAKKLRGPAREKSFKLAHDLYKHYLAVFPEPRVGAEVNYVFYMRFYFAEVLYELEEFAQAAENYDKVVDMNPHPTDKREKEIVLAAAEESVRAYDELVNDLDRKKPPEISGTEPKAIPPIKLKLIDSCQRYIQYVGSEGEKIVEIRYKMARTYYTYNHFDQAAPAFEDIVKNHPANEVACYAANLTLDIYNGTKNYPALKTTSRAFLDNKQLACGEEDRKKFARIEEQASFLLVKTEYEDKKKYAAAGKAYLDFYKAFPASENADDAVFNASVNYDLANQLDRANEVRRFLVEKLPDSPLVPETLYNIAQSYERIVAFEDAARYLEMFEQRYPSDKRSKDALYNSGLYRATLGDFDNARRLRDRFLSRYATDSETPKVAFTICEDLEKEGRALEEQQRQGRKERDLDRLITKKWEQAHDCYFSWVKRRDYADTNPDLVCYAQYRRGVIMADKTKYAKGAEEQKKLLLDNWPKWKRAGLDKLPRCAEAIAEIKFNDMEPKHRRYGGLTIAELNPTPKGKKKFDTTVKAKSETRDEINKEYLAIAELGVAEWGLAALYSVGEADREYMDSLLQAPIPNVVDKYKLTAEDKEMLRKQLRELAAPIEQEAIEAYRVCVAKANELGVYNKWSVRALDRLQKMRPNEFLPLIERLVPLALAEPMRVEQNGIVVLDGEEYKPLALNLGQAQGAVKPATKAPTKPTAGPAEPSDKGRASKGRAHEPAAKTGGTP